MGIQGKTYHEGFAKFFEAPTRETLRNLLQFNSGEHRACDFKAEWPEYSSLARHVLAIGNYGGGCLIAGVKEESDKTLSAIGLVELQDKIEIEKGIRKYIPDHLMSHIEILDFHFEGSEYSKIIGKKFQLVIVSPANEYAPFISVKDGKDIRKNSIYFRREAGTFEANNEELQRIISRRIETGHSTSKEMNLKVHIDQLKVLYEYIPRHQSILETIDLSALHGLSVLSNRNAPRESFQAFIGRMIEEKKSVIQRELRVKR